MAHTGDSGDHGHHIIPFRVLMGTFGALIILTVLTVVAGVYDLGAIDVPVKVGIATVKAALVVTIFMALWWDNPVNTLTFAVGTIFVFIFMIVTLFDTAFRGDLDFTERGTIMEEEIERERLMERDPETVEVAPGDVENGENDENGEDEME